MGAAVKSLLAKFAFRKAIGLYLGEHEVAVSKVAATPLGPVELASHCEACQPEELPGVVERLLTPLWAGPRRTPVTAGVPSSKSVLRHPLGPLERGEHAGSGAAKGICSSNVRVEDLTMDLVKGSANKLPIASVAACRKKYMNGVIATLTQLGVHPHRTEPSPCRWSGWRRSNIAFHAVRKRCCGYFSTSAHGLAVMVAGGTPLAWRSFPMPGGSERLAIVSAVRTLITVNRHHGVQSKPDYVRHSRPCRPAPAAAARGACQRGRRPRGVAGRPGALRRGHGVGTGLGLFTAERRGL